MSSSLEKKIPIFSAPYVYGFSELYARDELGTNFVAYGSKARFGFEAYMVLRVAGLRILLSTALTAVSVVLLLVRFVIDY